MFTIINPFYPCPIDSLDKYRDPHDAPLFRAKPVLSAKTSPDTSANSIADVSTKKCYSI